MTQLFTEIQAPQLTPPSEQQLAMLHDQELSDLAALWRRQAARGVRPAFGVAHVLEVECRRRLRERRPASATQ